MYTIAQPETVVSLVQLGRLPESLPAWFRTREIQFYEAPQDAVKTTSTSLKQTYLLQVLMPDVTASPFLKEVKTDQAEYVVASQFDPAWLRHLYVHPDAVLKLLQKKFNDQCPVPITINGDLYPKELSITPRLFKTSVASHVAAKIRYVKQDDLLGSSMQTHVNTVNCVGIMGKGIALQFKERYPEMFADYQKKCRKGEVRLGKPYVYRVSADRLIVNFPTKDHWKNKSSLKSIEDGLKYLSEHAVEWGISSLAIPPLGCGNGGLNWEDVQPLILHYLEPLNISIEIHAPFAEARSTEKPVSASDALFAAKRGRLANKDGGSYIAPAHFSSAH